MSNTYSDQQKSVQVEWTEPVAVTVTTTSASTQVWTEPPEVGAVVTTYDTANRENIVPEGYRRRRDKTRIAEYLKLRALRARAAKAEQAHPTGADELWINERFEPIPKPREVRSGDPNPFATGPKTQYTEQGGRWVPYGMTGSTRWIPDLVPVKVVQPDPEPSVPDVAMRIRPRTFRMTPSGPVEDSAPVVAAPEPVSQVKIVYVPPSKLRKQ